MPKVAYRLLKYSDLITVPSQISTIRSLYSFRANSAFDPDYTGIGHQPLGFDQMMALYARYEVISTKCTATFFNDQEEALIVGSYVSNGVPTMPTSTSTFLEQPGVKYQIMKGTNSPVLHDSVTSVVRRTAHPRSVFRVRGSGADALTLTSLMGGTAVSNPGRDCLITLFTAATSDSVDIPAVKVQVQLTMLVKFTIVNQLLGS